MVRIITNRSLELTDYSETKYDVPGIIIRDSVDNVISVDLPDILEEIENGDSYY